jgi:hypothetical protein
MFTGPAKMPRRLFRILTTALLLGFFGLMASTLPMIE